MTEELRYDVLVVGAGNAALSAALAALEQGARVGILEKAPKTERGWQQHPDGTHALCLQLGRRACGADPRPEPA